MCKPNTPQALFGALSYDDCVLQTLDLSRCGLGEKSAQALKAMLLANT